LGAFYFPIGGDWGQMGANVFVEFKNVFFIWGLFSIWGQLGQMY